MKYFAVLLLMFLGLGSNAQADITPNVTEALAKGNAQGVGAYFAGNVDLTLPGDEDIYKKAEATAKLAAFFTSHKPSSFEVKHRGTSKLNDHYRIGELKSSAGEFRVTFFMKKEGEQFKISQFRVEEAE